MSVFGLISELLGKTTPKIEPIALPGLDGAERLCLTFRCVVQVGEGRFNRLIFPGRDAMGDAAADWPVEPCPGSLNCKVVTFPDNFNQLAGDGDRIEKLDHGVFVPEFSIPREAILNNRIRPFGAHDNPRKGIAQAWKCAVQNDDTGECFDAWHVRRIDGTYPSFHGTIELMADRKLRTSHKLNDNTPLTITMYSKA